MGGDPVGGADKVSNFVSLLGAIKLNIAVLIDANPRDEQRLKAEATGDDLLGPRRTSHAVMCRRAVHTGNR